MKKILKISASLLVAAGIVSQTVILDAKDRQINRLKNNLEQLAEKKDVYQVHITAYSPSKRQCDEDPLIAASMRKVKAGTIAVSRDLFQQGWVFGKKVHLEGLGVYEINDLMNKRYEKRIDVFMWEESQAREFGVRTAYAALLKI